MTAVQKRPRRYTDEEVLKGLAIYALMSGAAAKVEPMLQEQGLGHVPLDTVREWAYRSRREDYQRVKGEVDQHVRARLADTHLSLAHAASELEAKAVTQLHNRLDEEQLDAKDLANILKSAAIAGGVHTDKSQVLAGKPTSIVHNDFGNLKRALEQRGIGLVLPDKAGVGEEAVDALGVGSGTGAVTGAVPPETDAHRT